MRRVLAALFAAALVAAACGDSGGSTTSTEQAPGTSATATSSSAVTTSSVVIETTITAPAPTTTAPSGPSGPGPGGEAIVADDQSPPTLNPYGPGGDNFIVGKIAQAIHAGVYDVDATTLELIPEVVTELPTVANGGVTVNEDGTMTVRYQIRDEAVWANRVPISGEDFRFTLEVLADASSGSLWPADEAYALVLPERSVAGPKTFEMTLSSPTILHERMFRWLIPRHQVAGTDALTEWGDVPWVSGGPFVFESWEPGGPVTLLRNENYWKTDPETGMQLPYLDRVVFRFIPETQQLIRAFASREVDVINPPPFLPTIEDLAAMEAEGVDLQVRRGPIWEHLNFQFGVNNRNPESWNQHLDYRRAVAHLIDKEAITEANVGGLTPPDASFLDSFTPGVSTGAWDRYPHDPEAARRLVAGLCRELGRDCVAEPPRAVISTTSNADARPRMANLMVEMFAAAGIELELQLEDSALFFGETLDYGTWDLGEWAWVGTSGLASMVSILDVFDPSSPPPDGQNFYRWGTPAVTGIDEPLRFNQGASTVRDEHTAAFGEVLAAARATVDPDEIVSLLRRAEEILADQVVIIPLYSRLDPGAVWADEIAGYGHNPSPASDLWNVEFWYRVDR